PELFTRWVQWGAFSPVFRTHATNDPGIERRMWEYPRANFDAMKKAVLLRYSLLPYIYTYSRMAYDSGVSLIRPMYYQHPANDAAYNHPGQYYFGDNLIVAPITKPAQKNGTTEQTIWLPDGNWYDFRNNNLHAGGREIKQKYALDEIPVFIKQGSIIPTQHIQQRVAESILDTLLLSVYTGADGSFNLYEDDGTTDNYRNNSCSFTAINLSQTDTALQLTINPDGKEFTGQVKERAYELLFINCDAPKHIWVNDMEVKARKHDPLARVLQMDIPAMPAKQACTIKLVR
ncbi:MAG TPA: TIM-barrel domain-containing protein, partial [Chitinophagales bacterium]|nr:TIM-barrel domain-containing protein [Chitinophagales bacterium]